MEVQAAPGMPEWLVAAAGDPKHGAEAQRLWQEHQAFRASFSSPDEARAMKELFPGGAQEAQTLRQAAQAVDQLDAAIYSGDARAQSEVVAELARANPAAFRQLFAEAGKVLAGMGHTQPVSNQTPTLSATADEGWGTQQNHTASQNAATTGHPLPFTDYDSRVTDHGSPVTNHQSPATSHASPVTDHEPRITNHESRVTGQPSAPLRASQSPQFDPSAYAAFERSTNDTVARDVRVAVGDTLARVLPEGIAEGAARRIGEDIFNEIHRTLAADRTLSEQVGEILRGSSREFTASGWRFGTAEQQRVAALLAGRAKQLVPGVSRRVIGEWTSSVLGASRSKAARQASAASRVDIAAPGGSLDSMPLRAMSSREIDYASMSDDEILGM
jgi:cell pole-organizing protein PopZ